MNIDVIHLDREEHSIRRLAGALRLRLRHMPEQSTLVVDLRGFDLGTPNLEDELFELMVSLNCCSKTGPLPGRRIVIATGSDALSQAIAADLDRLGRANLEFKDDDLSVLGSAVGSGAVGRVYAQLGEGAPKTIAEMCRDTEMPRHSVKVALERLSEWGLVLELPPMPVASEKGGRPGMRYVRSSSELQAAVLRAWQQSEALLGRDVA